ncbi:MAG: DUF5615 family PIN-like protein [Pseudomonadota bacterium]
MILWVDQNLPPNLARWLSNQGHEATHVQDLNLAESDDATIIARALDAQAVIISKDDDFAFSGLPPVVWIRLGNVANTRLLDIFERIWPSIETTLTNGETLVEVKD